MSTGYGERLDDNTTARAYLTPPASASWLANGRPLDAGTAHIIQSNQFHEVYESCRHLATLLGDGAIIHQGADGWDGLSDGARPNAGDPATAANPAAAISWSQAQCLKSGPHFVPQDAPDTVNPGRYLPRAIRFNVQVVQTSTTMPIYLALTATDATPDLGYVAFLAVSPASAPTGHVVRTLQPLDPIPGIPTPFTCRPIAVSSAASVQSQPVALWAWIGYKGGANDAIVGATIYEVRT